MKLRRDHAEKPVIVGTGKLTNHEGWPELADLLVRLRELEDDDLTFTNHVKNSLISSSVYGDSSCSIPRIAEAREKLDHAKSSSSVKGLARRNEINSTKSKTCRRSDSRNDLMRSTIVSVAMLEITSGM